MAVKDDELANMFKAKMEEAPKEEEVVTKKAVPERRPAPRPDAPRKAMLRKENQAIVWLSPEECEPWTFHDRTAEGPLSFDECEELINSIKTPEEQEIPALVRDRTKLDRPLKEGEKRFEIIYGSRRHFAASYNKLPRWKTVFAQRPMGDDKQPVSDEEWDRILVGKMHIENQHRTDISLLQKALSAKRNRPKYSNVRVMAEYWKESKSTIARYLKLATIFELEELKDVISVKSNLSLNSILKFLAIVDEFPRQSKEALASVKFSSYDFKNDANESLIKLTKWLESQVEEKPLAKPTKKKPKVAELYEPKKVKLNEASMGGEVHGKISGKGEVTIKLPPGARNASEKQMSKAISEILSELGFK